MDQGGVPVLLPHRDAAAADSSTSSGRSAAADLFWGGPSATWSARRFPLYAWAAETLSTSCPQLPPRPPGYRDRRRLSGIDSLERASGAVGAARQPVVAGAVLRQEKLKSGQRLNRARRCRGNPASEVEWPGGGHAHLIRSGRRSASGLPCESPPRSPPNAGTPRSGMRRRTGGRQTYRDRRCRGCALWVPAEW